MAIAAIEPARPLISLKGVSKEYASRAGVVSALRGVDLDINAGELVTIVGKSGSGKTTLINLLTGIDTPSSGSIQIGDVTIHTLNQEQLARWRGLAVGIVFQFFQLLPTLSVVENVMLPMDFCNAYPRKDRRKRALRLLNEMGIQEQADKFPAELSGGQQQRAAIARALANDPPLIVADEPTGNLDSQTAQQVMSYFAKLTGSGKTVVIVTHERELETYFARSIRLVDGAVEHSSPNMKPS